MGSQSAANRDFANDAVLLNVGSTQADCSVREQDGVAGLDRFDKGLLVDRYPAIITIPTLILGPGRSWRIPIGRPVSADMPRIMATRSRCQSIV